MRIFWPPATIQSSCHTTWDSFVARHDNEQEFAFSRWPAATSGHHTSSSGGRAANQKGETPSIGPLRLVARHIRAHAARMSHRQALTQSNPIPNRSVEHIEQNQSAGPSEPSLGRDIVAASASAKHGLNRGLSIRRANANRGVASGIVVSRGVRPACNHLIKWLAVTCTGAPCRTWRSRGRAVRWPARCAPM